ncbi:hypothetical protein ACS0TY_023057 [Phlomoides rotata]
MVTNGNKAGVSAAPPHELSVLKFAESRAPELESLHSNVSDRLDKNFQSRRNKRRRTTGHDNRAAKKFRKRVGQGDMGKTKSVRIDEDKVSRRVRRNTELKKNPPSGFVTSGDGTKRLRTHVWHAKRFKMEKLWSFYIPLGLHGRGRGSRTLLKKLKHGVLVHDASYYCSVQLEGPQDILMSVLSSVLVPSPSACCEVSRDNLAGKAFGTAMLHHAGKPYLPPIAPVTYMWRPLQRISSNVEELSTDNGEQNINDSTIIRQLWVWIHAAAFEEAYGALSSACDENTDMTRSAHCVSREGQLAKLELIGSKVFQLLQKTLLPANLNLDNSWHLNECSADEHDDPGKCEKTSIFENGHQISSPGVVSLVVKDPRLTEKGNVISPEGEPFGLFNEESQTIEPKHDAEFVFVPPDLWDASKEVCPPVEESVLCMEKHHQRKEFFCLGHKSSGSQNAFVDRKFTRSCPILLSKNGNVEDSVTRCSIVLPLSWVKAFWITFVSNGAQAIGLREKHWIACEIGLPFFPLDFPDCNAYSHFMAKEALAVDQKAKLVPPSKRPQEVPIPPPWNCVFSNFEKRSSKAGISCIQADELGIPDEKIDDMEKNSSCGESHTRNPDRHVTRFEGTIARTSRMLNDFTDNNLLLFPRLPGQNNCLYTFMRDKDFLNQDTVISELKFGKTPYFLRVLLCAFKEGAFEQGAVVCAPHAADVMTWTSSSEYDDQRLQIPQSSLKTYFVQLPSGKWELQKPEDEALHRHPIGFVTTGFVRGRRVLYALF